MKRTTTNFKSLLNTVTKEDFENYYFSHSRKDTEKHFNIGSSVFNRFKQYYNIIKPKEFILEIRNKTNLEKYGVENQFQRVNYIKESYIKSSGSLENHYKIIVDKVRENSELNGFSYNGQSQESIDKRKKTLLEKYGDENLLKSDYFKNKSRNTKYEKYGNEFYNNRDKSIQTCLKRYGFSCNIASPDPQINGRGTYHARLKEDGEFKKSVVEKRKQTCLEKFGEDYYINQVKKMIDSIGCKSNSKVNNEFSFYLLSHGIPFEKEVAIGNYIYDFKLGNYLLEIDPYSTHNSTWGIFGKPKDEFYHRNKTLNAIKNDYKCIHIFDWTDVAAVLFHVINKDIVINDTGNPVRHIFNFKEMKLTNKESNDTVIIFDDGFDVSY